MEHFTIATVAEESADFRRVLWTGEHTQLVIMTIPPDGEIGEEVHEDIDQILTFVSGTGEATGRRREEERGPGRPGRRPGRARSTTSSTPAPNPLVLYTVYGPPEHADGGAHDQGGGRRAGGGGQGRAADRLTAERGVGQGGPVTTQPGIFALGTPEHCYLELDLSPAAPRRTWSAGWPGSPVRCRRPVGSTWSSVSAPSCGPRSRPRTPRPTPPASTEDIARRRGLPDARHPARRVGVGGRRRPDRGVRQRAHRAGRPGRRAGCR